MSLRDVINRWRAKGASDKDTCVTRDRAYWLESVKGNPHGLHFVPEEMRDRELCLSVVREAGYKLCDVPMPLRDLEMCAAAVARHGWALEFVPDEVRGDAATADEFLEIATRPMRDCYVEAPVEFSASMPDFINSPAMNAEANAAMAVA